MTIKTWATRAGAIGYGLLVTYLAGVVVASLARAGILIPTALPLAVALIVASRLLGPRIELTVLAFLTVWLGATYMQTGATVEYIVFIVYVVLALIGAFKNPYAIAIAWLIHPLWDFVPRALPPLLQDLPLACVLFDIPIGLYVLLRARRKSFLVESERS